MKIFICWSGRRSGELAEVIYEWLPKFTHGSASPFLSSKIKKGGRWFEEIGQQLDASDAGLICLTPENVASNWIHYEAGALAKAVRKRGTSKITNPIFTYLLGVKPDELQGPLAEFQSSQATYEGTREMIKEIISVSQKAAIRENWEKEFAHTWKGCEQRLKAIAPPSIIELIPDFEQLFERKTFNEPLDECSDQRWIDRYQGAKETARKLKSCQEQVKQNCRRDVCRLFLEMVGQLEGYAMDTCALLIQNKGPFSTGADGKLMIGPEIKTPCERRRLRIRRLIQDIMFPLPAPVLIDCFEFASLTTFAEKKFLIHRKEGEIPQGKLGLSEGQLAQCRISPWDLDRIIYYLIAETAGLSTTSVSPLVEAAYQELEKLEAKEEEGSLMPLYYCIRAMTEVLKLPNLVMVANERSDLKDVLLRIERFITQKDTRDEGGQIKAKIAAIKACLGG
jgi:hypothetical protein